MGAEVLAFASGKGGTGKSTLAVGTGAALAALGHKVLLAEVDTALRSTDLIAGLAGGAVYDMGDVFAGRATPDKAMAQSALHPGLSIIPAPYEGGLLTANALQALCATIAPKFSYILLDVAPGIGEPFRAAVAAADRMILVETPDPVSLRSGRLAADTAAALKDAEPALRLLLNRVDPERLLREDALPDLDEAIDTVGAQLLGVVPESAVLQHCSVLGRPLPPRSREAAVFDAIARRIAGEDVPLLVR